jgi:AcrR family transcriptional regulator
MSDEPHSTHEERSDMAVVAQRLSDVTLAQRRRLAADSIEQAAITLFVTHPFEQVTASDIAEAAGVSVRTFYRYFPSKEAILVTLPRRRANQIAEATAARPKREAPFTAMRTAIAGLSETDDVDLRRWQVAVARGRAADRMAQVVVGVTSPILTRALAERSGTAPAELWPEVAGATVATALVSGARQWAVHGGSLRTQILAAVDIVGAGLHGRRK